MANIPLSQSLYIWQGQTFNDSITLNQAGSTTPLNLTGATFEMLVRVDEQDSTVLLELNTTNGGIVLSSPTTGTFNFNLSAEATYGLPTSNMLQIWPYDLMMTLGGTTTCVMRGGLVVTPAVTRPPGAPWWWWPNQSQPFPPLPGPISTQPAPPWYTSAQAVNWTANALIAPPDWPSGVSYPPAAGQSWPLPPSWPAGLPYPLPFGTAWPTLTPPSWWPTTVPYAPPTGVGSPEWLL